MTYQSPPTVPGNATAIGRKADSSHNGAMANRTPSARRARTRPATVRVLVIDVGGTHVKFRMGPQGEIRRFDSGPDMTAALMCRRVRQMAKDLPFEAVSIGYPGPVVRGRIVSEPHNLGQGWVRFDFRKALGRPVRVVNDATMQALGSYEGGRMLFLGLGTGLGTALILDGTVESMEIGHGHFKRGRTFEDYLGERGRRRLGTKKWRKAVAEVVAQLKAVFEVDYVVLGGGNVNRLKTLPEGARAGDNLNAFAGGLRLWERDDPFDV